MPEAAPQVPLDAEGRQLQLELEKARMRAEIADWTSKEQAASTSTFSESGIPTVADAPRGETTLSQGAGSFAPWLVHRSLDAAADSLAAEVNGALATALGGDHPSELRVLVVEDRAIRGHDVAHAQASAAIAAARALLPALSSRLGTAQHALTAAWSAAPAWPPAAAAPTEVRKATEAEAVEAVEEEAPAAPEEAPAATPGGEGPLGAALGLLGLLRTDYSLNPATAATSSSELAVLVAGKLATLLPASGTVQSDSLTTLPSDPAEDSLLQQLAAVQGTIATISQEVADLQVVLAPKAATSDALAALESTWTAALASEEPPADPDALRAELRALQTALVPRREAVARARAVVESVTQGLADVGAGLSASLAATPVAGGEPVMITALRGEQLRRATHVLYVHLDDAGGDVVTRRSLLGTSGRLGFLGAASTSWLLVRTSDGNVQTGGAAEARRASRYDIGPGTATDVAAPAAAPSTAQEDPLEGLEGLAKGLVVALIVFLAVVGVALAVNVVVGLIQDL